MKTFKELFLSEMSVDDMGEYIARVIDADNKKADEALWGWFEDNMSDSGLYAGDATPDEYLEKMSDKQIKDCYNFMKKKFPKLVFEGKDVEPVKDGHKYKLTDTVKSKSGTKFPKGTIVIVYKAGESESDFYVINFDGGSMNVESNKGKPFKIDNSSVEDNSEYFGNAMGHSLKTAIQYRLSNYGE